MGETATLAYTGGTTTNMTGNNDAALVGLDASQWTVVGDKGSSNNNVGLNKAGNIRLYAHKDSGNGNILTVSISAGTIDEITLDIKQIATYEVTAAGKVVEATGEANYAIGASSFSIQNKTTGETTQLHLNSISINYTSTGEGGENPETPEEPETPETPEEPENPEEPVVGGIDGYTKVTDITTLAAGDKVVLYCDDSAVGVTGFDGSKDATVAAAGWVEYVVEAADGGVLLKDGDQYISLTVKNTFKYAATGSVCNVNASGVLYCTLCGIDYFLYENANNGNPVYRMYADKTGNAQYKPFYVYKVGEGGGETPDTPDTPQGSQTGSCSGTSTGVDPFYTNANPQFAVQSLTQGFNWKAETTTTGVNITVQFLDNLPGMTSPYLFTFDAQGVLIGNPIQMSGWDNATRTATPTLTGLSNGTDLIFLVQVALEAGKILFTERVQYIVGEDCNDTALEQPSVTTTARKIIENGQIYIIHNGIRYNALGTQIK